MKVVVRKQVSPRSVAQSDLLLRRLMRWGTVHTVQFATLSLTDARAIAQQHAANVGFDGAVWADCSRFFDIVAAEMRKSNTDQMVDGIEFATDGYNIGLVLHLPQRCAAQVQELTREASQSFCNGQTQLIVGQWQSACAIGILHARLATRAQQAGCIWIMTDESTTIEESNFSELKEVG